MLNVFAFVILVLGWLSLPVLWWKFFRGKGS